MAAAVFANLNMIQPSKPHNLTTEEGISSSGTCNLTTVPESE